MPTILRPIPDIWILVGFLVLGAVAGALLVYYWAYPRWKRRHPDELGDRSFDTLLGAISGGGVTFVIVVIAALATLKAISPQEMIIERSAWGIRIVAIAPQRSMLWRWDRRLDNAQVVSYALHKVGASMRVEPITTNPKVREIKYDVVIEIGGSPEAMLEFMRVAGNLDEWDWLKYYLYELNEQRGRDIGTFYNPIDANQQERFSELVRNFLAPHLSRAKARFDEATFGL